MIAQAPDLPSDGPVLPISLREATRAVARRHLDLVALFGLRRTEAEKIREIDVQGDLIRVQPYGTHTLKTAWSDRVLPKALTGIKPCCTRKCRA
jgi:hypothetical protein